MQFSDVVAVLGQPENEQLEYKHGLPPPTVVARILAAFANTSGGWLALGVREGAESVSFPGLPPDAPAAAVLSAALARLNPPPTVLHGPLRHAGAILYVVGVERSLVPVTTEGGEVYRRLGVQIRGTLREPEETPPPQLPASLRLVESKLAGVQANATEANLACVNRYRTLTELLTHTGSLLGGPDTARPPPAPAARVLLRLVVASLGDTFEQYLTDLIVEIHLARPATLKSEAKISAEEIVDCVDMTEVYRALAQRRVQGLSRGAVADYEKYFAKLLDVDLFDAERQARSRELFCIRNLYAHANGIVDEKFLRQTRSDLRPGDEHAMSLDDACGVFVFYIEALARIDAAANNKFGLTLARDTLGS